MPGSFSIVSPSQACQTILSLPVDFVELLALAHIAPKFTCAFACLLAQLSHTTSSPRHSPAAPRYSLTDQRNFAGLTTYLYRQRCILPLERYLKSLQQDVLNRTPMSGYKLQYGCSYNTNEYSQLPFFSHCKLLKFKRSPRRKVAESCCKDIFLFP